MTDNDITGFCIWSVLLTGWVLNVVSLASEFTTIGEMTFTQVVQIIGIPMWFIGSVMGYVTYF